MNKSAEFYINKLNLIPHPEGGYFKEIYRSKEIIEEKALPGRFKGNRNYSTSIYFLLHGEQVSNLHRLQSDEIWHFYDGSSVKIYIINETGELKEKTLGRNLEAGEEFQIIIYKNSWFCAEVVDKTSFSLFGCTVSPGFDFNDFELGKKEELISKFPAYKELIKKFTK